MVCPNNIHSPLHPLQLPKKPKYPQVPLFHYLWSEQGVDGLIDIVSQDEIVPSIWALKHLYINSPCNIFLQVLGIRGCERFFEKVVQVVLVNVDRGLVELFPQDVKKLVDEIALTHQKEPFDSI